MTGKQEDDLRERLDKLTKSSRLEKHNEAIDALFREAVRRGLEYAPIGSERLVYNVAQEILQGALNMAVACCCYTRNSEKK